MRGVISAIAGVFLVFVILPQTGFGQDRLPKLINGGLLNGKATSLPKPQYPDAARAAHIGGMVGVKIEIDESGMVTAAQADPYDQHERRNADGTKMEPVLLDPTLCEAAEAAARQATFSPTLLSGTPVKVKGTVLYNFVADTSDQPARVGDIVGPYIKAGGGGVLNGKALSMPAPAYPAAARAVKAGGEVVVQVGIDESGNVTLATAMSGHPLLRAAAVAAAEQATFSPTVLNGQPVKIVGTLVYNFVAPTDKDQ